jgi:parallel beta-helix repeat protein
MVNTQILGRRAGRHNIAGAHHIDTGDGIFIPDQAINTTSALVSITGGDVTISGGKIEGGTTGVLVDPRSAKLGYQHVEIERAQIVGMEGAGVVIKGEVDAVMSNNHVLSNGMGGIVFAGSGYAQFVGNTISNNSYNGLYIQGSHEAVSIKNNMIHDNTQNGILLGSGTAVLVANDIGVPEDGGCQVRTRQVQNHVNITLYDNDQGTSRYDMTGACSGAQAEKRKPRSGWFGRKSG